MAPNFTDLIFLDFEASSLSDYSWPIELGIAWITPEQLVKSEAKLIRPRHEWPRSDWSRRSEAIHGIALKEVESDGTDASAVAGWYLEQTIGKKVISDNPRWEALWLKRLLKTLTREPTISIIDFNALVHVMFDGHAGNAAYGFLQETKAPHRAGADAARMANAFLAGVNVQFPA